MWQPPSVRGALIELYDTLRSVAPDNFDESALCLESDQFDTEAQDTDTPPVGAVFHYLIRVENECPESTGAMGSDSAGMLRTGRSCP